MAKVINSRGIIALTVIVMFGLLSLTSPFTIDLKEWEVPTNYKTLKNPQKDVADEDEIGEGLYKKHCQSCHGKEGYGDGTKAAELETEMRDLTAAEVQEQTDGSLYYKSIVGRDEMPNFEKKIPSEEDRWLLVNFIRTLE